MFYEEGRLGMFQVVCIKEQLDLKTVRTKLVPFLSNLKQNKNLKTTIPQKTVEDLHN